MLIIGINLFIILIAVTDLICLKTSLLKDGTLYWCRNENPILFIIALSLFNLFKNIKFTNKFINRLSSLTLYIYVIHENILIRQYTRLYIWKWIYEKFTYKYIVLEAFIYSIVVFLISLLISYIYKITVKRLTELITNKICESNKLKSKYKKIEQKMLKVE